MMTRIIDKYSWLLRLGIWIGIICWATQAYKLDFLEDTDRDGLPFFETVRADNEIMKELNDLSGKLLAAAEEKKRSYWPADYYADLKAVEILRVELKEKYERSKIPWAAHMNQIQRMMLDNRSAAEDMKAFNAEWDKAAEEFDAWLKDYSPEEYSETGRGKGERISGDDIRSCIKKNAPIAFEWLQTFYQRGIILAILLFLLRMRKDQGILKTFLGDKKKFFFAILFWPINIFRYPFNVVGEIVVEAELRRLGGFFRKLSDEERKLVRKVARSRNIFAWIKEFHAESGHLFERSFAVALFAIVIVNLISVSQCHAYDANTRDGTVVQCAIDDGQQIHKSADHHLLHFADFDCASEEKTVIIIPLQNGKISFLEKIFRRQEFAKQIDHIPLFHSCLLK